MDLIREGYAGSSSAAITEISRDPEGVSACCQRRVQAAHEVAFAHAGGVGAVMDRTTVDVRVED